MNAENPVQIDLFGVSATRTKDTRLVDQNGGTVRCRSGQRLNHPGWPVLHLHPVAGGRRLVAGSQPFPDGGCGRPGISDPS